MLYFNILSVSLSGKYANFGVFKLYGDKALERVLDIFFQLLLSIPMSDMTVGPTLQVLVYTRSILFCLDASLSTLIRPLLYVQSFPKLAPAYFSLIDVFATDHMTGLPSMPPPVLAYILRSLGAAIPIQTLDATSCTMACSAIDKICTFVLNWLIKHKLRKADDGTEDEMSNSIQEDDGNPHVTTGLYSSLGGLGPRASVGDLTGSANRNSNSIGNSNSGSILSSRRRQDQYQDGSLHWLVEYVLSSKDLLSYLFAALFQVIAFENRSNHWSLSRPLLGLILLNQDFFLEYTRIFVQAQLPDRQEPLQKAIDGVSWCCVVSFVSQLQ